MNHPLGGSPAQPENLSAEVRREIALRQEQEQFSRTLLDSANDGIFILGDHGEILEVNRVICERLDYSREELLAMNMANLDTPEFAARIPERVEAIRRDGHALFESAIVRRDGTIMPVEVNTRLIEYAGRPALLSIVRDITGRKSAQKALQQSETQYRTTIDAMSDAIHVVDRDLRIVLVNETFKTWNRRFGLDANVVGRHVFDVFPFLPDQVRNEYRQVFGEGATLHTEEANRTAGKEIATETWKIPISENGEVIRVVTVVRDITERKRVEQDLRKAHDELEKKVKVRTAQLRALAEKLIQAEHEERRRIVSVLHEDLQQTLAGVRYMLSRLPRIESKSERQGAIEEVNGILGKAIKLTRSLSVDLRPPILYEAGLGPALRWMAGKMKGDLGLVVRVEGGEAEGPKAESMREFLFHAVRELLFNVAKHAGVGEANVRIARIDGDGIQIEVRDSGAGFDSASVLGQTDSLGLFSIRERLDSLGGQMQVVSAPGKGTTITLTVPFC